MEVKENEAVRLILDKCDILPIDVQIKPWLKATKGATSQLDFCNWLADGSTMG